MPVGSAWPPVADLVPHTGVARLITHIVSASATSIDAAGAIPSRHPLVTNAGAPALLAIELGAQTAAAMEALARRAASGHAAAQTGSLVRVREARFHRAWLPVDTPIQVVAELIGAAPPLAIYRIVATLDGAPVLEAVISTHAGAIGGPA